MEVCSEVETPAALPLGKEPLVSTEYEVGWVPDPVIWFGEEKKSLTSAWKQLMI